VQNSSSVRIALLLTLLISEIALVVSLRAVGWTETGGAILWISSLLLATLPLLMAGVLLIGRRLRFSLRTLLVVLSLIAFFLMLAVLPLRDAFNSRHASRRLLAAGAEVRINSSMDDVYARWGFDPRPPTSAPPARRSLPFWLRPLARDLLTFPTDEAIREIRLHDDDQISALCREASRFRNLERICVSRAITPAGMGRLRQSLGYFDRLTDFEIVVDLPSGWLRSLDGVASLYLHETRPHRGRRLATDHLHDIAALPNLRILLIVDYSISDADLQILSDCKSLKRLVLKRTAVTELGGQQLLTVLPDCVVYRE
jgi:hypothetical protein